MYSGSEELTAAQNLSCRALAGHTAELRPTASISICNILKSPQIKPIVRSIGNFEVNIRNFLHLFSYVSSFGMISAFFFKFSRNLVFLNLTPQETFLVVHTAE